MAIEFVHFTDGGGFRASNQDAYCARIARTPMGLTAMLVVCDGMGGLECGEVASATVSEGFGRWFDDRLPRLAAQGLTDESLYAAWAALVQEKHRALCDFGARQGIRLGTTLSAILLTPFRYYIFQVGDTRVYLDDGARTRQLTVDQTLAMREYMAGRLTAEQFRTDTRHNVLLQCVGERAVEPVFQTGDLPRQGACLLCSDGFYHFLSEAAIHEAVTAPADRGALRQRMLELGGMARAMGEQDNMSCVLLRWNGFELPSDETEALADPAAAPVQETVVNVKYINSEQVL